MSEELETVKEGAKAIQEAAKAWGITVEQAGALFRWAGQVVGTAPEDLFALGFGDYLKQLRFRNLVRLQQNTDRLLRKRGVEEPEPIAPKLAHKAFEAASMETEETLQKLWSRLMANAMDPNTDISLRPEFIDTLKQLVPLDVLIFKEHARKTDTNNENIATFAKRLERRGTEVLLSAEHLHKLGCLHVQSDLRSTQNVYITAALGEELWLACQPDAKD